MTILPSICDNFLPPRRPFYVNLYCQIASRIMPNLQHKFLNKGLAPPPPPFEQCSKKQTIWYCGASLSNQNNFLMIKQNAGASKHPRHGLVYVHVQVRIITIAINIIIIMIIFFVIILNLIILLGRFIYLARNWTSDSSRLDKMLDYFSR